MLDTYVVHIEGYERKRDGVCWARAERSILTVTNGNWTFWAGKFWKILEKILLGKSGKFVNVHLSALQ